MPLRFCCVCLCGAGGLCKHIHTAILSAYVFASLANVSHGIGISANTKQSEPLNCAIIRNVTNLFDFQLARMSCTLNI